MKFFSFLFTCIIGCIVVFIGNLVYDLFRVHLNEKYMKDQAKADENVTVTVTK